MKFSKRYFDLNTYFKSLFGSRVHKITVDAGLSCPNRDGTISTGGCIYCNAKGSGTGARKKGLSIAEQIENSRKPVMKRFKAKKFIVYFQSFSNTYAPFGKLKKLYEEALAAKDVAGLSIGTRPDCVDEPILDLLKGHAENHHIWLEYGLQSANDRTLARINRGHDFACFEKAVEMTKKRGLRICAHAILGLPGETRHDMIETAKRIAELEIDGVKIHLLYVAKGTALEKMYENGDYICLGQEEYAELVCDFLERIPRNTVVQRLTGDPHPWELVAPAWSLEKRKTLDMINEIFERRDSCQGRLCG